MRPLTSSSGSRWGSPASPRSSARIVNRVSPSLTSSRSRPAPTRPYSWPSSTRNRSAGRQCRGPSSAWPGLLPRGVSHIAIGQRIASSAEDPLTSSKRRQPWPTQDAPRLICGFAGNGRDWPLTGIGKSLRAWPNHYEFAATSSQAADTGCRNRLGTHLFNEFGGRTLGSDTANHADRGPSLPAVGTFIEERQ